MPGGKQRLSEVAGDDLFGIADRRQVDLGTPFQQLVEIRSNGL